MTVFAANLDLVRRGAMMVLTSSFVCLIAIAAEHNSGVSNVTCLAFVTA